MKLKGVTIRLFALSCLAIGQVCAVPSAFAQPATASATQTPRRIMDGPAENSAILRASPEEYRQAFNLAYRVMSHDYVYKFLNEAFAENVLKSQGQRASGLTLSQVVYILVNAKATWPMFERYLEQVQVNDVSPETKALRESFRAAAIEFTKNHQLMQYLIAQNDATQPLDLAGPRDGAAFSRMSYFANREGYKDHKSKRSGIIPPDDLHRLVIDFVKGAKQNLMTNVFDFDSQEIAESLKDADSRGVDSHIGIDMGVFKEKASVQAVVESLLGIRAETILQEMEEKKGESLTFTSKSHSRITVTLVNSVGLNHQKVFVRDVNDPDNAATLVLSGNFTYSCLHPNGDAALLPPALRPASALPNSNEANLIIGQIPAVVAEQNLRKTLVLGVRGKREYPLGGAFRFLGPTDSVTGLPEVAVLVFSPNGAAGNVARDIYAPMMTSLRGPMAASLFVKSSPEITTATVVRSEQELRRGTRQPFRAVGDPSFSMREWSSFLSLSGIGRDVNTKKYLDISQDPSATIAPLVSLMSPGELDLWRGGIRVASREYGESHVKLADGTNFKVSVKVHGKSYMFPDEHVGVIASSYNPSKNAESNTEHILIVRSSRIIKRAMGVFEREYEKARSTVVQEANRRNRFAPDPGDDLVTPFERRMMTTPPDSNNMCPALFSPKKAG